MSKVNKGRRKFLKGAGSTSMLALSGPALDMVINCLVNGAVNRAQAATMNQAVKNYIQMNFPGGPPRWMFDHWLTPHDGDNARRIANGSVNTRLVGSSSYDRAAYSTTRIETANGPLNLPWMWRFNIATPSGEVPLANLLNNMAVIRGIDMEINSHSINRERQDQPVPSHQTIGGRVADHTQYLINGLRISNALPFQSDKGLTPTNASMARNQNCLNRSLSDFKGQRGEKMNHMTANYRTAMEKAIGSINKQISASAHYSKVLGSDRANAELIVRRGLNNLDEFWNATFPKYQALISATMAESKSSKNQLISDKPIRANANAKFTEIATVTPEHSDFRNLIDSGTYIHLMAETFTVIEYMMKEELTGYINASMMPMYNLKRNAANARFNIYHDLHSGGCILNTYLMTLYFKAFSSCLYELMEQLKGASSKAKGGKLFDSTLINLTSEFNRSPRDDGTGSDHGFTAHSVSLIGGMLKGPLVVGDIKRGSNAGRYKGTWGEAAPTQLINGTSEVIKIGHVGETIVTLLGVPGISVNAPPLIDGNGNPLTKKARIV